MFLILFDYRLGIYRLHLGHADEAYVRRVLGNTFQHLVALSGLSELTRDELEEVPYDGYRFMGKFYPVVK